MPFTSCVTIIITTHYLAEAQELCDHIAFINHGEIVHQDKKDKLLETLGVRCVDVEFDQTISKENLDKVFKNQNFGIISENKIRFEFNASNHDFNQLLAGINKSKLNVKNFNITQPDLEDIFKVLIK